MVGFVDVDTELLKPSDLLEALVLHQLRVIGEVIVVEIPVEGTQKRGRLRRREQCLCWRVCRPLLLDDDLLGVRNDDVVVGPIEGVESRARVIQEVEFDVGVESGCILLGDDERLVEGHDLAQGLQNSLVWRKDKRIVDVAVVLGVLLC